MAKEYPALDAKLVDFIERQKAFLTGRQPIAVASIYHHAAPTAFALSTTIQLSI